MEYMYAALLLHKAGKPINEESMKKTLEAAGVTPDAGRIKAVVAALEGANIDEVISKASAVAAAPVAAAPAAGAPAEAKPAKSAEDEKKKEEEAAAGLGALFG